MIVALVDNELRETQQTLNEKFQKYPKNYQENHHYKSVKQKLMTAEDDQDIIKFPFTTTSLDNKKSQKTYSPSNARKIEKYKGKKFETVPVRTITYSTPLNYKKIQELSQSSKTSRKSDSDNKFASKNLFTNMKKLKDMRKTNYKNRITSMQKKQNPQKPAQLNDNLDLFRLTSTNFKYKQRMFSDGIEDVELLRKFTQTPATTRNVIKFQNSKKSNVQNQINQEEKFLEENSTNKKDSQKMFFALYPVKTEGAKSAQKPKPKAVTQTASVRSIVSKPKLPDRIVSSLIDEEIINQQTVRAFVRYSESTIETQNDAFRSGLAKLRELNNQKSQNPFRKSEYEHIPHSFKASFRVKHIEDNKNILFNTIKKKANVMERDQLVEYLKKVVK